MTEFRNPFISFSLRGCLPNFRKSGHTRGDSGGYPPYPPVLSQNLGRTLFLIGLALILGGLLLTGPDPTQAAPPAQAPDTPPSVAGGQAQWTQNCQPCHGPTGQGDGPTAQSLPNPLPNLTDSQVRRQAVPVDYFDVIKNGRMDKMMPPWGNQLSDEQIWDAAAYVWSLGASPQALAAGETLYLEQCAACHGENGTGDGPEAPAQIVDFTNLERMVQQSQADLQAGFLAGDQHAPLDLPEAELWQVLDYVRTFSFELALPEGNGILTGQVINATTNEPVGALEVTLHVLQNEAEIDTRTTQTDSEGNYVFENLPTEHSVFYVVEGEYEGIPYLSDEPGLFMPQESQTTLNLEVYEPTSDDEAVYVTQLHYLIAFTPETINAVQVFVVGNSGNQAYVGQNGQTFAFAVPDEAVGVTFQGNAGGTRFIPTDVGYADTTPIPPGEESLTIVASYDIPYDSDDLTIQVPIPANTNALNVLMSNQGADLSSDQVQFVETRQAQGSEFAIFNGGNLAKGETLTLNLSDLNDLAFDSAANMPGGAVTGPPLNQGHLRWVIVGLGGLAIVAVGMGYPLMRPRLVPRAEQDDLDPHLRRQKLLLLLARLDEAFEAGELDEAVYRQARARYKAELAEIMEV